MVSEFLYPRKSKSLPGAPRLKRKAQQYFKAALKKQKSSKCESSELPDLPAHVSQHQAPGYSNLRQMSRTPMAKAVLKSLMKKGADIKFMCEEVCGAAVEEGSDQLQTRLLASINRESKFHSRLVKDLPTVDKLVLPVQIKKKLKYKTFSAFRSKQCASATDTCSQHMQGFVRPSSWFRWLEKHPDLLRRMVYGNSSADERQLLHGFMIYCVCESILYQHNSLRLVDLIHETEDLREVLAGAGWVPVI